MPWRPFRVRGVEHLVTSARVFEPMASRRKIHRTQLPLPQGVVYARLKTALLLFVARLEPDFDQLDSAIDKVSLRLGTIFQKSLILFFGAEAHHMLHSRAVVPTAIENHDLAGCREMLHVSLHIHLRFLAVGWSGQRPDAEHARTHAFGQGFDGATLAGGIPAFEDDNRAQALVLDPLLQFAEFRLQLAQLLHVLLFL